MKNNISKATTSLLVVAFFFLLFSPHSLATKYYSYQSGTWAGTNIWTTDSTGSTLLNSGTPVNNDIVCILTGRTITASANISTSGLVITIAIGATLDLASRTIPAITLNGTGLLRSSRVNSGIAVLPTITAGNFFSATGGTVEYYPTTGSFYIDDARGTYFNLWINLAATSQVMTVRRNLVIYGDMEIIRGTFQINGTGTTKLTMQINGDLAVKSNGKITTGTGNTNVNGYSIGSDFLPPGGQFHSIYHELTIAGNFTNSGIVRFTNLLNPDYGEFTDKGAVTVRFTGESNTFMTLDSLTDFYNLIIDKGVDQTYVFTINSKKIANFALFGSNAVGRYEGSPFSPDNPEVRKALWIKNGTLMLTGYIWIPSLTEGRINNDDGNGDYPIGSNSQLWIAGPNVAVYSTATSNGGYPEAPEGSVGVAGLATAYQAISIYGKLRVSDGFLSTRHSAGIIFWNTANSNSAVIIEGGTVNASVMRSTYTADGRTSYLQTGGTVIVRGNEGENGEMNSGYPIFAIPNPNSSFVMSGGELIIRDKNDGTGANGNGLYLNCDPGNYSVTGGTITFETNAANTPSVDIKTKVPLWNLNIKRLGTTGNSTVNMLYDLSVSNTITIYANATLNSGTGNFPVNVAGDFKIRVGGTYTPNTNTTTFYGVDNYFLWNEGTITSGLYNLTANKTEGSLILVATDNFFTVRHDLTISTGTLADGGKILYVQGNVINNGTHVGAGKISMNSTSVAQTISGNGQGVFQNLELNNTLGSAGSVQVTLANDIQVAGNLILANDRIFDISSYQVTLAQLATVLGTMSNSRFIRPGGLASNGGLKKIYSDTTAFLFPVGTGTNYTPAIIHIRKIPEVYGSVSVRPVPIKHPFATNTNCLATYWRVEEAEFMGIQPASVRLVFNYGSLADNSAYVPGKYNPASWTYINDATLVSETANTILFSEEDGIMGDYTAGFPAAFGIVTAFYSRTNGSWSTPSTWSNIGFGGSQASTVPGASNPVFIGDGSSYFHTVTVTAGSAQAGSLSLMEGSVLSLGTTANNNFGFMLPNSKGIMRISSSTATAIFPAGDFGEFLGPDGGTVEYFSGTVNFTLPLTSSTPTSRPVNTYYQLMLTPATGYSIILPNTDLVVYADMTVQGASSTAYAKFNNVSSKILSVKNDLVVNSGTLLFQNNFAQVVNVSNNISIAGGAFFNIANSGTAVNHLLTIKGGLNNEGIFEMSLNPYRCDVKFVGTDDVAIIGRGLTTDFYSITVDKGTSSGPLLNILSSYLTFTNNANPVTLVNGTFRITSGIAVTISANGFSIPATSCLSANGGTFNVAMAASDDADVYLDGMIEVTKGAINIGSSGNNTNNDIEYAGAGSPTIEVRGGALFVNGQVRRSLINGLGSLTFKQSGTSTVTINGRNSQPIRSKLEVLNTGSTFNMIGGTLNIIRGGSITYNDLYLRPENSVVTGGTVVFGNISTETTGGANTFSLDAIVPLNNLTVDGTTNPKTVTLAVHGLTLLGNLLINAGSVFNADSNDVSIAGNLTNLNTTATAGIAVGGYRAGSYRQVTTLNGSLINQTIAGFSGNLTNFSNLIINNTKINGSVTLQVTSAIRVNSTLTLTRGILADGGNTITVIGNISNSATHSGAGRILMAGTTGQTISGNGTGKFGNLTLSATNDVKMTAQSEITGVLTFQTKMLDIGNNLLILSNTANNATSGTSATSYIRTDGVLSDAGVRKSFPTGSLDYTFPIGVNGKYTPAQYTVASNGTPGTITVIPVNAKHPSTTNSGDFQLLYYWHVLNSGFSGLQISQFYTYLQTDVRGNENQYVAARFYYGVWDLSTGSVLTGSNVIRFQNVNFIFGDYTAGYNSEFLNVPIYYSRDNMVTGNWADLTTWSTVSHSGPAAASYPNGQTAFIGAGHTVYANGNSRRTFALTLEGNGILDLSTYIGHDFGNVYGTGTIKVTASGAGFFVFPAGDYSNFTSTSGGTVELINTSGVAEFPYLTTYNKLTLTGAGSKQMTDVDITLNGTLTNQSTSTLIASSVGNLIVRENWVNHGFFTPNNGTVIFDGVSTISGTIIPQLNNLVINAGKTLTAPRATLPVSGSWINNGIFNHNAGTINFNGNSIVRGASTTVFYNILIFTDAILTGRYQDNMVIAGNWVNNGTFDHNDGTLTINGNTTVSGESITTFGYLVIDNSYSLTGPDHDRMCVARDFINNGTFFHNEGTLVFNGADQVLAGTAQTQFENITIAEGSNTIINTDGQTLGAVLLSNGTLNANGYLTLLSNNSRTALIDGTGTGKVLGTLIMQRYLPSGYGYKYFSSPFKSATVYEFDDDMDLYFWFPTLYRYDENRFFTGWLNYTNPDGPLYPMQGYAINFGDQTDPKTVDVSGEVNNNTLLPSTLYNRNRPFTKGFNLAGNPYPSPVDWDSGEGWVKSNIDDALYYFNAGGADMYSGTYSSYVNKISSDQVADNLIGSMQGFFIHVSNGSFPVSATLIFTNDVRVNDLSPIFHKDTWEETRPLLRIGARFQDQKTLDPLVIYYEDDGTMRFDNMLDALKLMNTDILVPSLYAMSSDTQRLSINAIQNPTDSLSVIPLGIKLRQSGWICFNTLNIERMPLNTYIYLVDKKAGAFQNLMLHPGYKVYLEEGECEDRFSIVFSLKDLRYQPDEDVLFHVYSSRYRLFVYSSLKLGEKASMAVYNMLGQTMYKQDLCTDGYHEFDMNITSGIYVVKIQSSKGKYMRKVFISNE